MPQIEEIESTKRRNHCIHKHLKYSCLCLYVSVLCIHGNLIPPDTSRYQNLQMLMGQDIVYPQYLWVLQLLIQPTPSTDSTNVIGSWWADGKPMGPEDLLYCKTWKLYKEDRWMLFLTMIRCIFNDVSLMIKSISDKFHISRCTSWSSVSWATLA